VPGLGEPYRKYLAGAAVAFGIGVAYALLGVIMVTSTMDDPFQPSPGMAALSDLAIWAVLGLTLMPLALGGIYLWTRRTLGVEQGPGCASVLLSTVAGVVAVLVVGLALP
jgi:hypothetical protein